MIRFTTVTGCTDGKKKFQMEEEGKVTVSNMDVLM